VARGGGSCLSAGLLTVVATLSIIGWHATKERRARSNTALAEALHGREDWPFWPSLIAEGTDSPEDEEIQPMPSNLGFGRRNPHCSNCGDLRGGPFGHESSECKYRAGMTAGEVAAILPEHQRNEFWDQQIDRYFADQEATS
jgi:hypothetical protein